MNGEAERHERAARLYAKAAECHERASWAWAECGELERAAGQAELGALRWREAKRAHNDAATTPVPGHQDGSHQSALESVRRPHRQREETPMGDWLTDNEHRVLVHFSDGGAGMREYDPPLTVGDEIHDGRDRYRITRVEAKQTPGGFGHAWAERVDPPG